MSTNLDSILMGLFNIYFLFWANFQHSCPTPLSKGALSITVPWNSPSVKLSIGAFYGLGARVALSDSYIPSPPPRPPCTHWHSYIPPTPGSPKPKLGHRETIVVGCTTVLRIIIAPPSSTYSRSLSQFVLCRGGAEESWGVGRSAPDSRPGLKIA